MDLAIGIVCGADLATPQVKDMVRVMDAMQAELQVLRFQKSASPLASGSVAQEEMARLQSENTGLVSMPHLPAMHASPTQMCFTQHSGLPRGGLPPPHRTDYCRVKARACARVTPSAHGHMPAATDAVADLPVLTLPRVRGSASRRTS